jgi:hypothetical protein
MVFLEGCPPDILGSRYHLRLPEAHALDRDSCKLPGFSIPGTFQCTLNEVDLRLVSHVFGDIGSKPQLRSTSFLPFQLAVSV